jgi:hypothetical protein
MDAQSRAMFFSGARLLLWFDHHENHACWSIVRIGQPRCGCAPLATL